MKFLAFTILALVMCACSAFKSTSSTGVVTLTPLGGVVCDVESTVATEAAATIAAALNCTAQSAIVASLEGALGNANLCGAAIPASSSLLQAKLALSGQWKTVADIPKSALKPAVKGEVKSMAVKPMGVVGTIVCPVVINTSIGFLSNTIPAAWACSVSNSASTVESALDAACEAAIGI